MNRLTELGKRAKAASRTLSCASTAQKNAALAAIADALCAHIPEILAANEEDLKAAAQNGMSESLQDRLRLSGGPHPRGGGPGTGDCRFTEFSSGDGGGD